MVGRLRKYLLPNLPYVFLFWLFSKLGTAYRLAAGANLGEKLVGMLGTMGAAFESFAPPLVGFDLLVGQAGAAVLRLVVYFKAKNAKRFRKDQEYGSAR